MPPRIVDVVFETRQPGRLRWGNAVLLAFVVHGAFAGWARYRQPSLEEWADELALKLHQELSRQDAIELPKPPPPRPDPPPPPPPVTPPPVARRAPPPPAQAARVLTQAPNPEGPVDFGDAFVVGEAKSFAGGTTTSTGISEQPVHTEKIEVKAPKPRPEEPDHSTPVSLEVERWQCPWPPDAEAAEIDEQSVLLRVQVDASGQVRSVNLVSDPGFGFGRAALACAERTRFEPAHDRAGRPVAAQSPPIRVRFTR